MGADCWFEHLCLYLLFPTIHCLIVPAITASKHMIDTGAGVIDADYRGTVFVLLFNYSDVDFVGRCDSGSGWFMGKKKSNGFPFALL